MKKKIIIIVGAVSVVIIALGVFVYLNWPSNMEEETPAITTSDKKIYQEPATTETVIPNSTNTAASQLVDIYWIKSSAVDGSDTCNLYDKQTKQIHFTVDAGGGLSVPAPGDKPISYPLKTYYKNDKVSINEAADSASQYCFK